ncbi:MAG: hypothetical protein IJV22_08715 [Bacteroidales bacterium]|nr:hypothetical protein [Bacteroidales bacterium]
MDTTPTVSTTLSTPRLPYEPPRVEVFTYTVEQGYAASVEVIDHETVSEITNTEGDNYHGEWF